MTHFRGWILITGIFLSSFLFFPQHLSAADKGCDCKSVNSIVVKESNEIKALIKNLNTEILKLQQKIEVLSDDVDELQKRKK